MRRVEAFCKKWDMLPPGELVLCAVSGGRDSMALLHLLTSMAEAGGFAVAAAHYNHHLRPTADRDEAFVRDWCCAHGVALTCGSGDVLARAKETGQSVEEALLEIDRFLDNAVLCGLERVTVIHGKGTGVLRSAVHAHLKGHRQVKGFRLGAFGEGEHGVTVVELK